MTKAEVESIILSTSPVVRMKYKDVKSGNFKRTVDGTYDANTKTIEVNVGRAVHAIMDIMPDEYVAEVNESGIYGHKLSKAEAACEFYNESIDDAYGELEEDAPEWMKKADELAKAVEKDWLLREANHAENLDYYNDLKSKGC